jgi:neutral ceramidase
MLRINFRRRFFLFSLWVGVMASCKMVEAAEPVFRAGTAVVDITPTSLPISMTGSFDDRQAKRVEDPLNVRALVLDDGTTRLGVVVCDSCLIPREIMDEAKSRASKSTGIPATNLLVSATHTHTAVTVLEIGRVKSNPLYNEMLTARIALAIEKAAAALQPAEIACGVASLPGEVNNRRWKLKPNTIPVNPLGKVDQVQTNAGAGNPNLVEPAGPTDPEVSILAVQTADGRPLAVWATYALHYVGNIPPDSLSADYFGEFARQMRKRLANDAADSPFVAMLANGASGDINNINFRTPGARQAPMEQIRIVAGRLADQVETAYRSFEFRPTAKLAIAERELELGVRKPNESDLAYARSVLAEQGKRDLRRDVYAEEALKMVEWPDTKLLRLQAMRIGDFGVASIPCEPFCQIGLDIKAASPFKPTCVVGLANGYNGYLPTPEQHELGGYETWRCRWSYLEPNASRKITSTLVELLNGLAKPPK